MADHLRTVIPEEPLRRRAERLYYPLPVDDDDRIGDGVEDRAQPQLTLALRQFGSLAGGNVADDTDKDRIAAVTRLADGELHRKYRPVLAPADDLAADPNDFF